MREIAKAITGTKPEIERILVEGCSHNDRFAQKELYNRYCDAMYTVAFRIVNDKEEAHDALQEAFIQIFRDIKQFRFESTLGSWIKTIVIRTTLKQLKKNLRYETSSYDDLTENQPLVFPDMLSGEYLEKMILSLPEGYRTVFLLTEVEGYSHQETAQMLGISIGTSKSQLHHAKNMLRKRLSTFI